MRITPVPPYRPCLTPEFLCLATLAGIIGARNVQDLPDLKVVPVQKGIGSLQVVQRDAIRLRNLISSVACHNGVRLGGLARGRVIIEVRNLDTLTRGEGLEVVAEHVAVVETIVTSDGRFVFNMVFPPVVKGWDDRGEATND